MVKNYLTKEEVNKFLKMEIEGWKETKLDERYILDKEEVLNSGSDIDKLELLLSEYEMRKHTQYKLCYEKGLGTESQFNLAMKVIEDMIERATDTINILRTLEVAKDFGYLK